MLLNIFNNHGISYGLYQVPLLISLNTETRSRMIIFEYTKGELDLIKRLSYIKKYLKRIFRLKSELSHLFFKINKLCREKKKLFYLNQQDTYFLTRQISNVRTPSKG